MKLSLNQEYYFKNSAVRNKNGELLVTYHGSGTKIDSFNSSFTGEGMDQYGSGFYFTTDKSYADEYTTRRITDLTGKQIEKLGGEDNPSVVQAYLNVVHPIYCDGLNELNLSHVLIPSDKVYDIVKKLPTLYHTVNDENEPNPLADYNEEFWEIEPKTREQFEPLIEAMVNDCFQDTNLKNLDILFGKYSDELHHALHEVMGYDGIIIDFKDSQHIVTWFPEQIKDISNLDPQHTKYIRDDNQLKNLIDNATKRINSKKDKEKIINKTKTKGDMDL